MSQSNTRVGDIRVLAGESLAGLAGRLVVMTHDTGVAFQADVRLSLVPRRHAAHFGLREEQR